MNNDVLVSVVIATYNESPSFIKASLDSIQNQTYKNLEVFVLDDSTVAETCDSIDTYKSDSRFHIVRQDERMGFVRALNMGLEFSNGKYIARMDADDICEKNRIKYEVAFLEANPEIDIVGGQMNIIDNDGKLLSRRNYPCNGLQLYLYSIVRDPLAHPTVLIRRNIVDEGYRYDEVMKKAEDIDLWLRILNDNHKIANIPDIVLNYRIENGFTEKRTGSQQKFVAFARKRNASWKRPLFSALSVCSTEIYSHLPSGFLTVLYNKENAVKESNDFVTEEHK